MKKKKVSVVIPCYNSEKMIETVVKEVLECICKNDQYNFEVILVNDGSADRTWQVIRSLACRDNRITAINLSGNFGQHNAVMAAYRFVSGDIIVEMDDDGENDPGQMYLLIEKLQEGYDFVCAEYEENRSRFRKFGSWMNDHMAYWMIGKPKDIYLTSYHAMQRFVMDEMTRYQQPYPYIAGLILRTTKNIGTVPMAHRSRLSGHSGYTIKKMLSLWFNGFTAFSVKPLRLASGMGILASVTAFIGAVILLVRRIFFVEYVSGWASTILCIIFFSGMVMLLLGIIGEYVGRIYISINNAPQYVVKEVEGGNGMKSMQKGMENDE